MLIALIPKSLIHFRSRFHGYYVIRVMTGIVEQHASTGGHALNVHVPHEMEFGHFFIPVFIMSLSPMGAILP